MADIRRALAALLVVASACDSSPHPGETIVPTQPPAEFRAQRGASFDEVILSWRATSAGIQLEQRLEDGTWGPFATTAIGPGACKVALDPSVPEDTLLTFRARHASGTSTSEWAEATYHRTFRPPTLHAGVALSGDVSLSWVNASAAADALWLERGEVNLPSGAVASWTSVPVAFGTTTHLDGTIVERVRYRYRVRYGKGGVWSDPAEADATTPLLAPVELSVERVEGGVRVTWTNRSQVATANLVTRYPWAPDVELPADATSWVEPTDRPWPTARYGVRPHDATAPGAWAFPGWVMLPPHQVATDAVTLGAGAATIPPFAWTVVRDGAGSFTVAGWRTGAGSLVAREADAFAEHPFARFSTVPPTVALDGSGRPHALSYGQVGAAMVYTHEWHDGAAWHAEDVADVPGSWQRIAFGPRTGDEIEVLVAEYSYAEGRSVLTSGVRSGPAWTWSSVPIPADQQVSGTPDLRLGPDGTAYVAADPDWPWTAPWALLARPAGGAWGGEAIPGTAGATVVAIAPWSGGVGVLVQQLDTLAGKMTLVYVARSGTTWSEPETVVPELGGGTPVLAVSADGARAAVVATVGAANDLTLFTREPLGWAATPLARDPEAFAAGRLGDGRLWIAARANDDRELDPLWALWEEPAP